MKTRILAALAASAALAAEPPRAWTQAEVESFELPLSNPKYSPVHVGEAAYYQIPERVIYKSYPVYGAGREPAGYADWLKRQEPSVEFDVAQIRTQDDWVRAGEVVFNAPTTLGGMFFSEQDLRDAAFFGPGGMPVGKDGTVPFARWVVRRKGVVELGSTGCATCHTRVLADGTVVPGAQGNNPTDRQGARLLRMAAQAAGPEKVLARVQGFARQFEMPWLADDPNRRARTMTVDEFVAAGEAIPPGVSARANTSMVLPPQIPDLIGVRERRFLDHTGLIRHRGVADLMRYSTLAQDVFALDRYGDAPPVSEARVSARYSDAQLYALALYLYSLQPPGNPHPLDAAARRGRKLFEDEGCVRCHTPPLYTNNQVLPAAEIGTDSRYALQTHKGTGVYKVPSLKGVWYRGPFGHDGAAATLEEWLDPARLSADHVPGGFRGVDGRNRGIPGHRFGLSLPVAQRSDLIAFLKTL